MDFSNHLFRCSSIGNIMVEPRTKKETLSKTTKSYLEKLHKEFFFKRTFEISSKYLDKGIEVEEASLSLYTNATGSLVLKNKERFNNEFLTGEPDIIDKHRSLIIDIKSCWDLFTFPLYESKLTNKMYYWQLQGYMYLTGIKNSQLAFCLVDTPLTLIQDEIRRTSWKNNMIEVPKQLEDEIQKNMTFKDIDPKIRCKIFEIEYNLNDVERLKKRILQCRNYLNNLTLEIKNNGKQTNY